MEKPDSETEYRASRRRFLTGMAVGAATLACPAWARSGRQTVTVLTNHNDDTFALFEEAFEKAQPDYRIKIVWLMPPDAAKLLRRRESDGPDVWWTASPRNHIADIAPDGLLQALPAVDAGLPSSIGNLPLVAADNTYRATQITAFSFLVNRKAIAEQQLPWPSDWPVLAQPEYAGKVALTDPLKVRFGTLLLDVALQSYGWEAGWGLLSAITGNAVLLPKGLADEVSSGRQPVALHVDVIPNAEQRFRQPMERVYPGHGGIVNAGYISIMKNSANVEGARAFVNFVLSAEGQRLMLCTDLPRLPVRPEVYANGGEKDQFNPFAAQAAGQFTYQAGGPSEAWRAAVVSALFAAMDKDHNQLAQLWARLHAAERKAEPTHTEQVAKARHALEQVPLAAAMADSEDIKKAFRPQRGLAVPQEPAPEGNAPLSEAAKAYATAWEEAYRNNRAQAAKLLDEMGA